MLVIMAFFTASAMVVKGAYLQACLLIIIVPLWVTRFYSFCYERWDPRCGGWAEIGRQAGR